MTFIKRFFKQNTHNILFGGIAAAYQSINRLYENRNHDIYSNGEYWLIKRLESLGPRIVFDVGANTGKYCSLLIRHYKQADIYCFEPVTKTFELLRAAIKSDKVHFIKKDCIRRIQR